MTLTNSVCKLCGRSFRDLTESINYKEGICKTCWNERENLKKLQEAEKEKEEAKKERIEDLKRIRSNPSYVELENPHRETWLDWYVRFFINEKNGRHFVSDGQRLYIFNGKCYVDGERETRRVMQEIYEKFKFFTVKNEEKGEFKVLTFYLQDINKKDVISNLKDRVYVDPDKWNQINGLTMCINVQNGILYYHHGDKKWILGKHDKDYYFNYVLPFDYNPDAKCPGIDKLLSEWAHPEDISFLWEWIGYHLTPGYRYKKFLFIYGDSDNGKGEFLKLLKKFLGHKAYVNGGKQKTISAKSLRQLMVQQNAVSGLYRMMANIIPDMSTKSIEDINLIKALTGGDDVSSFVKFKDDLEFCNEAKLTASGNKVPWFEESDQALFKRMIICEFPNEYSTEKGNIIHDVIEKTVTETELSGMLNKAIDGLHRLESNNGQFSGCGARTWRETKEVYEQISNPLYLFVKQKCKLGGYVSKTELHRSYHDWGKREKLTSQKFNMWVRRLPYPIDTGRVNDIRVWSGLSLKNDPNELLANRKETKDIWEEVDE